MEKANDLELNVPLTTAEESSVSALVASGDGSVD